MSLTKTLRFLWTHPIGQRRRGRVLRDYLRWQLGSRLVPGPILTPFVADSALLVRPGMTGATGNVYVGLHEVESMAFLLHLLRPEDTFLDVGANIGSYTVLASRVVGARSRAWEPVPETFSWLERNVAINGITARVELHPAGVGAAPGRLTFTADRDTGNRVLTSEDGGAPTVDVPVETLDAVLEPEERVALLKIDVEGFETAVLDGARALIDDGRLDALSIELAGAGALHGFDEGALHRRLVASGLTPVRYAPFERRLTPAEGINRQGNSLYVRDLDAARDRVRSAPAVEVKGLQL